MVITAKSKSFKSTIALIMLVGLLLESNIMMDNLGLCFDPNVHKENVIYYDCEQSKFTFHSRIRKELHNVGITHNPVNLKAYHKRAANIEDRMEALKVQIEHFKPRAIILDGLADFVASVNDETECNKLVAELLGLADKYNCAIITIIHENPFNTKMRGHLGSAVERKCEAVMGIEVNKETGDYCIEMKTARNFQAGVKTYFRFDEGKGRPVSVNESEVKSALNQKKTVDLKQIFGEDEKLNYKTLCERIMDHNRIKIDAAKKRVQKYRDAGLISKNEDDTYFIVDHCGDK
jgi:hypothetical protein